MDIFVYDRELNLLHIVDNFNSLIWTRKYNKVGEFELHLPITTENIEYLKIGNIIRKDDDTEGAIIEKKQITLDNNGKEILTIKGSFLSNYFSYRLVVGLTYFKGKAEEIIYSILLNNVLDPSTGARRLPNFKIPKNLKGYTESIDYQNSFGNMLEEIENICNVSDFGFRSAIDFNDKKILFEVYKGIDRSIEQNSVAPCIFSREFENVLSENYSTNDTEYKNVAIVQGEGEGTERTTTYINWSDYWHLDRREIYVDARDLRKELSNGTILSDEEYQNVLIQRGNVKLAECKNFESFECVINSCGNNKYKIDFDLGDKITFMDSKLGIVLNTRITELQEIYENGEIDIIPTFGNNVPTIQDKLKKI